MTDRLFFIQEAKKLLESAPCRPSNYCLIVGIDWGFTTNVDGVDVIGVSFLDEKTMYYMKNPFISDQCFSQQQQYVS